MAETRKLKLVGAVLRPLIASCEISIAWHVHIAPRSVARVVTMWQAGFAAQQPRSRGEARRVPNTTNVHIALPGFAIAPPIGKPELIAEYAS